VTAFENYGNIDLKTWRQVLKAKGFKEPVVIVTDLLGHFTTLVYFEGTLTIVDSMKNSYIRAETIKAVHKIISEVVA
jgi:hypothetical protein